MNNSSTYLLYYYIFLKYSLSFFYPCVNSKKIWYLHYFLRQYSIFKGFFSILVDSWGHKGGYSWSVIMDPIKNCSKCSNTVATHRMSKCHSPQWNNPLFISCTITDFCVNWVTSSLALHNWGQKYCQILGYKLYKLLGYKPNTRQFHGVILNV